MLSLVPLGSRWTTQIGNRRANLDELKTRMYMHARARHWFDDGMVFAWSPLNDPHQTYQVYYVTERSGSETNGERANERVSEWVKGGAFASSIDVAVQGETKEKKFPFRLFFFFIFVSCFLLWWCDVLYLPSGGSRHASYNPLLQQYRSFDGLKWVECDRSMCYISNSLWLHATWQNDHISLPFGKKCIEFQLLRKKKNCICNLVPFKFV